MKYHNVDRAIISKYTFMDIMIFYRLLGCRDKVILFLSNKYMENNR